ncbi:MAG: helix-turn-helix domain-containing protein [Pseudomonadota bacterium]
MTHYTGMTHQTDETTRERFREAAERVLQVPSSRLEPINAAVLNSLGQDDPTNAARVRANNRMNVLHWATCVIRDPGAPVPANLARDMVNAVREQARLGLATPIFDAYRAGERAAWIAWMDLVFEVTNDPAELRAVLEVSARSISGFVERTARALHKEMDQAAQEAVRGSPMERLSLVRRLMADEKVDLRRAAQRLGYAFDATHTAAVLWDTAPQPDIGRLEHFATSLLPKPARGLVLQVERDTIWLWSAAGLRPPRVSAPYCSALGPPRRGAAGFKDSMRAAHKARRVLERGRSGKTQVTFEEVQALCLLTEDRTALQGFVFDTLGPRLAADRRLCRSLSAYLAAGGQISAAADDLRLHRNTVARHVAKVETLLPKRLNANTANIALALGIADWLV